MAETPIAVTDTQQSRSQKVVLAAKSVDLTMITYADDAGTVYTQLAIVGDNEVHLLEGRAAGLSKVATPQGRASEWLANGIFEKLGRKRKSKKEK
jgi:hypothetical protein